MKKIILLLTVGLCTNLIAQFGGQIEIASVPDFELGAPKHETIDLDNDGDNDVVCSGSFGIVWIENLGEGLFSTSQEINLEPTSDFEVTDYDSDGDLDILYSDYINSIYFLENDGFGSFEPAIYITWTYPGGSNERFICADLNGDGNEDIITIGPFATIIWRENTGIGEVLPEIVISLEGGALSHFDIVDFDADGDLDVFWSTYTSSGIWWVENLGDGTFAEQDTVLSDPPGHFLNILSLDMSDMDNDGDLDALFTGIYEVGWVENMGDGTFGSMNILSDDYYNPDQVFGLDIYIDGMNDIIFIHPNGNEIIWYKNLGGGIFGEPNIVTDDIGESIDLNMVDIDYDGDWDVVSSKMEGSSLILLKNQMLHPTIVEGQIYIDINENGTRELEEPGISLASMLSTPSGAMGITYPDGTYIVDFDYMPDGPYEIAPELEYWGITSPYLTHNVNVEDPFYYMDTLDFGMIPEILMDSIRNDMTGGATARCEGIISYWVGVANIGTTMPSGIIHLLLDDSLTYLTSDIIPDSIVGQNLYWSYDDLFYFDSHVFMVQVETPGFEADSVTSVLVTTIEEFGETVFTCTDVLEQPVTCAYDPNDKTSHPKGVGELGNIPPETEWMEYTVRFHNTGTDTAYLVIVRDQLDENLDWMTFEPLFSSHEMYVNFSPSGELAFIFEDIMLPDSIVNEVESHGFFSYKIKLKPDLPIGTTIENTAEIYFDGNPAVITNTTLNTIYELDDSGINVDNSSTGLSFVVYPNPFDEYTTIYFGDELVGENTLRVFNLMGEEIYSDSNLTGNSHILSGKYFKSGLYILTIENEANEQLFNFKIVLK